MSFLEILDTLLIKPLYLLFEVVYVMANKVIGNPGLSIIVLSLFMNFLVLPLYMRADSIQEEEHAVEKKLQRGVAHIKRTFSGDERMMMLQTYYRQNNYKPFYVLRSAVSLFLQIPFFIAAYRFLSGLQLLNGVSFGLIADLGRPDGMLQLGGMSVNLLPIIMTAVNLVSCVIFTKGSPLKAKLQLYIMALFFLVFLYNSPSGLVFYWTLNNVFSLVKTIFYKLKNPRKIFNIIFSALGIMLAIYGFFFYQYSYSSLKRKIVFVGIGVLMQMPLLYSIIAPKIQFRRENKEGDIKIFLVGTIFLSVLLGGLIPSAVIKTSPLEFIDITYIYNPLWYILSSFCMAAGTFIIWIGVFYLLARPSMRLYFERGVWIFSGAGIINYMFFGKNLGILTPQLIYAYEVSFTWKEKIVNAVIMLMVIAGFCIIGNRWKKWITEMLIAGTLAVSCMTAFNIGKINTSLKDIQKLKEESRNIPRFTLSKTGKNVIVFMLDRAIGAYIPYLFDERPELAEQFSGFTYYSNTVSFGSSTIFGTPALFGGYEYTPVEMNKRENESLESKQNEALKVMPVLFQQNDYKVTVCDPPYAGYQWISDLSIYDEYPDIQGYIMGGKLTEVSVKERMVQNNKRNFFCYSIFKATPLCIQNVIYDRGNYNKVNETEEIYVEQSLDGLFCSVGLSDSFMGSYNELENLPYITDVVEDPINTFLMMVNNTTHSPMLLQEPEFIPAVEVDNTEYEKEHQTRVNLNGRVLRMDTKSQVTHYHVNMAAMIQLGEWFDYMRENDVYDNTRIILVSDHGFGLDYWDEFRTKENVDIANYYPLLMVKDFNSKEFTTSEEFMTNGDVPFLATENIIKNPINPFTGKIVDTNEKLNHAQFIISSPEWSIEVNNGNTFLPANWYEVHDDMREPENWKLVAEGTVLPTDE